MITLESRPPNIEGQGEIRIRELVRNALRMRPDRIIVGEVRGAETLDMLQAMNTGHEGSLTTIHANTPRDALSRLETLVMTGGVELPHRAIREQISSAFDVLVQISRLVDGSRRVTHITEVLRMESDVITLQDLFMAKPPDEEAAATGRAARLLAPLACTGLKPHFLEKMAANSVILPPSFFNQHAVGRPAGVLGCAVRRSRSEANPRRRLRRSPRSFPPQVRRRPRRASPPSTRAGIRPCARPLVTPRPVAKLLPLTENGNAVAGYEAANLGRQKSVVLAVDRSQSMLGKALADATAAARAFIRTKPRSDRISIVAVGKSAVQLTSFSSSTATPTRLFELSRSTRCAGPPSTTRSSSRARRSPTTFTRRTVLVLLTDGQEVSSDASLAEAIDAARTAKVAVYPIAIESPSFSPAPLKRLAAETGGRYAGAATSGSLPAIYAALAAELRRTWTLSYLTTARPGDRIELAVGTARAETLVPGTSTDSATEKSGLPEPALLRRPAR